MRSRRHSRALCALALVSLGGTVAGCSSGESSNYFQTSSLAPRPEAGMSYEPRRPEPPSTYAGPPLAAPPTYAQQANPPRPSSSYTTADSRWRAPTPPYAATSQPNYVAPPHSQPYQQAYQPRWQTGPYAQRTGAPITTGSLGTSTSHVIIVREGDTLYNLSNRYGVTIAELVRANRITDGKIRIGQSLVVPPRTR